MRQLTKSLTEAQLARLRLKAEFAVKNAFDKIVKHPRGSVVQFKELPGIKSGTRQLVLPIGRTNIDGASRAFVLKMVKGEKPFQARRGDIRSSSAWQEANYLVFSKLGFPAPAHYHIGSTYQNIHGVVVEDLTANGMKLEEAHNFDFTKLKNGAKLENELNQYISKLAEMEKTRLIHIYGHASQAEQELPFLKAFHVQYDPKTRKGRLVMADLDHLLISTTAFPAEIKKYSKPYSDYIQRLDDEPNYDRRRHRFVV